jgi:hypothetical protein
MSRIRANTIVNGAGTGAPNFPRGAIISGISTITADIDAVNIDVGTGTSISSPDTNVLTLGTNNVERLRITSNGNIGINTDVTTDRTLTVNGSNSIIEIKSPGVDAGHYCQLYFNNPGTSSQATAAMWRNPSSNAAYGGGGSFNFYNGEEAPYTFYTGGVNERVRIQSTGIKFPAGNGIDFSSSEGGSATSSLLDDYEEGTWTPTLSSSGGGLVYTINNTVGYYTKVGNMVNVWYYTSVLNITNNGVGFAIIGGLPFTSSSASQHYGVVGTAHNTAFTPATDGGYVAGNNTQLIFQPTGSISSSNWVQGSGVYLMIHASYQVT